MADIIDLPGGTSSPQSDLRDLASALRDMAGGQRVEQAVHDAARRIADDVRGRRWTAAEAREILEPMNIATAVLQDIVGGLQTSYLVTYDDTTLERCGVLAGALSLVCDAGALIRLSAGLPVPADPDDDDAASA